MDVEALTRQLFDCFQALEEQGIIDDFVRTNYSFKQDLGIDYFIDLVTAFCNDAVEVLLNLSSIMQQPIVDYESLDDICVKLQGSAACFGACRLNTACRDFRDSIDSESKEGCTPLLIVMNDEFFTLRTHLESILQLEKSIVEYSKNRG